jgi:RNA polymerase sigma factor (sigma-70 family)
MEPGANVPDVEDAELAAAVRDGDTDAFGLLYDRYADRLFSYAVTIVRDRDTASDVVHDAFLVAHQRIDQLRDPSRVRSWLYAIVRSEALRTLRSGSRTTVLEDAGDVMDTTTDLDSGLAADDARALVLAALSGLGGNDREVIELALRHELDNAETASALGVSSSHASALVSRAKGQFEKALTAVVLMRTRGRSCATLAELIADSDTADELTPLLRKRIARHAADCEDCERERRGAVAALPGVAIAAPFLAAPTALRDRLVANTTPAAGGGPPTAAVAAADRAGRFDRDGFPRPASSGRRRRVLVGAIAGAAVLALGVGAVAVNAGDGASTSDPAPVVALAPSSSPPASPTPSASAPSGAPRSASSTPTSRPSDSETPDAATSAGPDEPTRTKRPNQSRPERTAGSDPTRAAPRPSAAVSFSWTDLDQGECPATFTGRVTANATGAEVASVVAIWAPINGGSGTGGTVALTRTGPSTWRGDVSGVPTQQENVVRVRATTDQGVVTTSGTQDFFHICPG